MKPRLQQRAVLQLIASGRATSQLQLARSLGAPANTIHGVVGGLLRRRLIRFDRTEIHGRGRPIRHYRIARHGPVLTIQWLGSVWHAGVFQDRHAVGGILTRHSQPVNDLAAAILALREIRDTVLQGAGLRPSRLAGVVLAINAIQPSRGRVLSSSVIPWVRELSPVALERAMGCRVLLDSAGGHVAAELKARASENIHSLVVFNVGDGVSAHGARVDPEWGAIHLQPGELGHVIVDPKGPRCGCGHRGCLEAMISGPAMMKRGRGDASPAALFDRMEKTGSSDPACRAFTCEFLDHVGWGVSVIANLVRPDVIVLAGYGLEGRASWLPRIEAAARAKMLFGETAPLRLEFPRLSREDQLRELAANPDLPPIHERAPLQPAD